MCDCGIQTSCVHLGPSFILLRVSLAAEPVSPAFAPLEPFTSLRSRDSRPSHSTPLLSYPVLIQVIKGSCPPPQTPTLYPGRLIGFTPSCGGRNANNAAKVVMDI